MDYVCYHPGGDTTRDVHLSIYEFKQIVKAGLAFGWEPMGTIDPSEEEQTGRDTERRGEWPSDYFVHDCQTVREDDARAFSRALFRALDIMAGKQLMATPEEREALKKACPDFNEDWFLDSMREFAEFAAEGAFDIC